MPTTKALTAPSHHRLLHNHHSPLTFILTAMGRKLPVEFGRITQDNVEQVRDETKCYVCFHFSEPSCHQPSSSLLYFSQLRKVNLACFPVQYQETFYKDVLTNSEGLCKFAYWNGFVVGAACARIETIPDQKETAETQQAKQEKSKKNSPNNQPKRIYIMTLGVLAAYRNLQIGTQLIQSILDHYEQNKENAEFRNVQEMTLHVQISNDDAMKFYQTRFGFERGEMVENYYRRIDPPHCYKLYKKLR